MPNLVPNEHKYQLLLDWLAGKTIKAAVLMTNTTVDSQNDAVDRINDYTTYDELDDGNYVRPTVTGLSVAKDDANDRGELHCDDIVLAGMAGDASRMIQGVQFIEHVDGTAANDIPGPWCEFDEPKTVDSGDFTITIDPEGFHHLT